MERDDGGFQDVYIFARTVSILKRGKMNLKAEGTARLAYTTITMRIRSARGDKNRKRMKRCS